MDICQLFGRCGGCAHQDLPYSEQLKLKEQSVRALFCEELGLKAEQIGPIVASPSPLGYRHRIDLSLKRNKEGEISIGYMQKNSQNHLSVEQCPIAMSSINEQLSRIKKEAIAKLPVGSKRANLTIKTGHEGLVQWGGIGKKSLHREANDYLWANIRGDKLYYSLDTFFQPNLSILEDLLDLVESHLELNQQGLFLDLYSGVGLFGIHMAKHFKKVILVEDNKSSMNIARHNCAQRGLLNVAICPSSVEDLIGEILEMYQGHSISTIVDPPRNGLNRRALETLVKAGKLKKLLYLSCYPQSLVKDLKQFLEHGWNVEIIRPLDFFPQTEHIENLAVLTYEH